MLTRREILLAGAALAVAGPSVHAFEADAAQLRYRRWLTRLQDDLAQFSSRINEGAPIAEALVEQVCAASIVPGSRAAQSLSQWLSEAARRRSRGGAMRYADVATIALHVLDTSMPVGYGGRFHEPAGSRYPSDRFSVWYMHVGGRDVLQSYFNDKTHFPMYQLPPNGTLRRHAYPFLLFDESGDAVRLAGFGAEWMGAVIHLQRKQYS